MVHYGNPSSVHGVRANARCCCYNGGLPLKTIEAHEGVERERGMCLSVMIDDAIVFGIRESFIGGL